MHTPRPNRSGGVLSEGSDPEFEMKPGGYGVTVRWTENRQETDIGVKGCEDRDI
jgi:hypothetical protein